MKGSFTELFVKYFIILSKGNNKAFIFPSWHPHSTESQDYSWAQMEGLIQKRILSLFSITTCKYIKKSEMLILVPHTIKYTQYNDYAFLNPCHLLVLTFPLFSMVYTAFRYPSWNPERKSLGPLTVRSRTLYLSTVPEYITVYNVFVWLLIFIVMPLNQQEKANYLNLFSLTRYFRQIAFLKRFKFK